MGSSKSKKQFVFVGGTKCPRKQKTEDEKKPMFIVQTMKFNKPSSAMHALKNPKSKSTQNTKVMVTRAFNKTEPDQFVHVDYYYKRDPTSFIVKNNDNDTLLNSFVFNYFSSASMLMNKNRVSQLIGLVNPWEKRIMARLVSNRLITNLKYPFDPPIYRGPALESTKIGDSGSDFTNFKLVKIESKVSPLESHLIYLYFKYFSLLSTCVTRNYFEYRLNNNWFDIDFQSLLATVLCCACSYLAIEPFIAPVNISKLSEYYYERSQSLYYMIDENGVDRSHSQSVNTCKIVIQILSNYIDYNSWTDQWSKTYKLMLSMGWGIDFTKTKEEILKMRPLDKGFEYYLWEQKLFIWCAFNYHTSTMFFSKVPVKGMNPEEQTTIIMPALEALYDNSNDEKWTTSHEGRLCYYLYKSQNIFERARLFALKASLTSNVRSSPTSNQMEEMHYIKSINNEWKNEITNYCDAHQFNQGQLAMATILYLYYHFFNIITILPYIPRTARELNDPVKLKIFSEYMLSATSIGLLMDCQGTWMVILGNGSKNLILSIAWCGVRLCLEFLEELDESQLTSTLTVIKNLAVALNSILINQLTTCWSFKFQKQLNSTITQKRSMLLWLTIWEDPALKTSSNSSLKPALTCDLPPKLDNYSKLKIL
ncbi:hypothetical protein CONCODRAFT_80296, partial [Conidiobolus coronatus NRRL 28638]